MRTDPEIPQSPPILLLAICREGVARPILGPVTDQPTTSAHLPGPADLETFRHAQRRHRWAARIRTAPAILAAALMGIPLSVYLSPVLIALAIVVTDLVNLIVRMPDLGGSVSSLSDRLIDGDPGAVQAIVWILGLWLIPGVVLLIVAYLFVRWRLARIGGEGIALGLGGRPPRTDDAEERQVVNVVTELALAAGIVVPRVLLYDDGPANALVFGRGPNDATVLIARSLLDEIDREATQGVIARLIASAADGDLSLATDIGAVYVTYGLLETALSAFVSPTARARLRAGFPPLFGRRGDAARDAAGIAALLGMLNDDDVPDNAVSGCLTLLTMGGFIGVGMSIINLFFAGPLLVLAWRSRGYLADATAVELTRNPDALARALRTLGDGRGLPGSAWLELLLVVGGTAGSKKAAGGRTMLSDTGLAASLSPSVWSRLARLVAMGADPAPARPDVAASAMPTPSTTVSGASVIGPRRRPPMILFVIIIVPLLAIVAVLAVIAAVLIVYLVALAAFIVLAIVAGPLHEILRGLAGG
jgi:Zn-dependent protease with chaperone function